MHLINFSNLKTTYFKFLFPMFSAIQKDWRYVSSLIYKTNYFFFLPVSLSIDLSIYTCLSELFGPNLW